jgi:hypothetical protein
MPVDQPVKIVANAIKGKQCETIVKVFTSPHVEPAMQKEYFIVRRGGSEWQVVGGGETYGPYLSKDAAQRAAIDMAKADFRNFVHAKVYFEEGMLGGMTLVYDSSDDKGR